MGEFPNFVVFNSGTESFWNSSVFAFLLAAVRFIQISVLTFECDQLGVSNVFMAVFSYEHE
jgi:hypothetical protein